MNIVSYVGIYVVNYIFFFRIAINSLSHYVVNCDVSKSRLEKFLIGLGFPFRLLALKGYQHSGFVGDGALTVLENLDEIKQKKDNFRLLCAWYAVFPVLLILGIVIGAVRAPVRPVSIEDIGLLMALIYSLIISWRFGNKLCSDEKLDK